MKIIVINVGGFFYILWHLPLPIFLGTILVSDGLSKSSFQYIVWWLMAISGGVVFLQQFFNIARWPSEVVPYLAVATFGFLGAVMGTDIILRIHNLGGISGVEHIVSLALFFIMILWVTWWISS